MKRIDPLKEAYERITGKTYSSRQWRRIRSEYLNGEVNLKTIKVHARLRSINGRRNLTIAHVQRVEGFDEFARCLDGEVTGEDIYEAFRFLNPVPSPTTIRRWGVEIGVPLIKSKWYTTEEAQQWVRFVGDHVRFKFPESAMKKKKGA
jgi:hypothetical protein